MFNIKEDMGIWNLETHADEFILDDDPLNIGLIPNLFSPENTPV